MRGQIDVSKVYEALALLGIEDIDGVRSVHIDAMDVVVTRFNKVDGNLRLAEGGGVILVENRMRINRAEPGAEPERHPFEDLVLHEEDKALLYTSD